MQWGFLCSRSGCSQCHSCIWKCACAHYAGVVSDSTEACLVEEYVIECCLHWCEEVFLKSSSISSLSSLTLRERGRESNCCPCSSSGAACFISPGWLILVSEALLCRGVISRFNDMIALMCGDAGPGPAGGEGGRRCLVCRSRKTSC